MSARGVVAALLTATLANAPTSDGLVRGGWVSDPATAVNPSGQVRDIITEVRSLDDSVGVVKKGDSTTVTVQADVLFDFDRADLTPAAREKLDEVVQELRDGRASGPVVIGGHADGKGTAAYNQALSEQRAGAVATALTPLVQGIDVTLQPRGYGDTQPVAPNARPDGSDDPEGRARNRRVTVTFTAGG